MLPSGSPLIFINLLLKNMVHGIHDLGGGGADYHWLYKHSMSGGSNGISCTVVWF